MDVSELNQLLPYAKSETQRTTLKALVSEGSAAKAAKKLNVAKSTVQRTLRRIRQHANLRGYGMSATVPEGFVLRGQSTKRRRGEEVERWDKTTRSGLDESDVVQIPEPRRIASVSKQYDSEGGVISQWVREQPDLRARESLWTAFSEALKSELPVYAPTLHKGLSAQDSLMVGYPIGDQHLGMLAWSGDAAASYDLEIGQRLFCSAMDGLADTTPSAAHGVLAFLGDFMHFDSMQATTPSSGNVLDASARFPQIVRAAVSCMRYAVSVALKKHKSVHLIVETGNHDLASSVFLRELLSCVYEGEPRLTIDTSPQHYHYHAFGKVLIGTHHGHGAKMQDLPLIMATDVPKLWGDSAHRYIWTGHVHHASKPTLKDHPGVEVESFRVLAPNDAWHMQSGYRSKRDIQARVLHAEHGEINRVTLPPSMLNAA